MLHCLVMVMFPDPRNGVDLAGLSAQLVPWRVRCSVKQESWFLWVSKTWWTVLGRRAIKAVMEASWTRPSSMFRTTMGWILRSHIPTLQRWESVVCSFWLEDASESIVSAKALLPFQPLYHWVFDNVTCNVQFFFCAYRMTSHAATTPVIMLLMTLVLWTFPVVKSMLWWRLLLLWVL